MVSSVTTLLANKAWGKQILHTVRLYEQLIQQQATYNEMASTLELYIKRWQRCAAEGLQGIASAHDIGQPVHSGVFRVN